MKSKEDDTHWSAIARVWVGVIGIIVAVVFGVLELKKKKDRTGRGGGKRNAIEQRGSAKASTRDAVPTAEDSEAGDASSEAAVTE